MFFFDNWREQTDVSKWFKNISKEETNKTIKQFNQSSYIENLPSFRDSKKFIKKLHEKYGYYFIAISSFAVSENSKKKRKRNIKKIFGNIVFDEIICLPLYESKKEVLSELSKKYKNSIFIDDMTQYIEEGKNLGFETYLMTHSYNLNETENRCLNWKEIYKIIEERERK